MKLKRGKGRPRKPDWLRDEASSINAAFDALGVESNITEAICNQIRGYCEEYRRERVSDGVRKAYGEGRNNANAGRKDLKDRDLKLVADENKDVIFNPRHSAWRVAKIIIERGKNHGRGQRALSDLVSHLRKFVRPNG